MKNISKMKNSMENPGRAPSAACRPAVWTRAASCFQNTPRPQLWAQQLGPGPHHRHRPQTQLLHYLKNGSDAADSANFSRIL